MVWSWVRTDFSAISSHSWMDTESPFVTHRHSTYSSAPHRHLAYTTLTDTAFLPITQSTASLPTHTVRGPLQTHNTATHNRLFGIHDTTRDPSLHIIYKLSQLTQSAHVMPIIPTGRNTHHHRHTTRAIVLIDTTSHRRPFTHCRQAYST